MSASSHLALLVPSKLTAPQPRPFWVYRERLVARLASIIHARLTVVVAPAGFGKSTLVGQWVCEGAPGLASAAGAPPPVAWLTLDEHDQHGLRFLSYVAGAITSVYPHALPSTLPLLTAQEPPPLYLVIQALLVDLSALPGGLTLILDDYHAVVADEVQQTVAYLLRHLPPSCHVVILSRVEPPLSLARLRAEQQLTELRASDLRFTYDETEALLTNLLDRAPSNLVSSLQEETEGWPLMLQLAALAYQETETPGPVTGVARRQVAEYLAEEVFDRQPAPIQEALLALAVPERFCAGLGAAILGAPDDLVSAEERLSQLIHANLMLIPLDDEERWYRFHPLFRDLLLRRLRLTVTPETLTTFKLRAAHWLESEGLFEEAVRGYLDAGAETEAAEVVERLLLPALGHGQRALSPDVWLRLLPAALVARRPALLLVQAHHATFTLDLDALATYLRQLDTLMGGQDRASVATPWPGFSADREALRGALHFWEGRSDEATAALSEALAHGPLPWVAVQALVLLGQALAALGRHDEALQLADSFGVTGIHSTRGAAASFCRCGVHMHSGELDAVTREARQLLELAIAAEAEPIWRCYAEAFLAGAAYERGELAVAAEHYRAVVQRRDQANSATYMGSMVALALIAIASDDLERAAAYEQAAWSYAAEVGGRFLRQQAAAVTTRVALARGEIVAALRAAEGIGPDIHLGMSLWTAAPRLGRAQALLAAGEAATLAEADDLVAECLAEVVQQRNMPLLAHCLTLQARLRQAQGRPSDALDALEQALEIAEPRGLIRAFLDGGPSLAPLLQSLQGRGRHAAEAQRLLAYLHSPARDAHPVLTAPVPSLPELLTRREHEILELLAERWSDKEIAARLVIASNTVRKHTSTIFGKLGVNDRREAVEAARALGLLPKAL